MSKGGQSAIVFLSLITAVVSVLYYFGDAAYLWVKAVHVMAIIAWMAGMLYLPRLFVYHVDAAVGSAQSETFKTMEHRLRTIIMTPAMVAAWGLGLWLAWKGGFLDQAWFHTKMVFVVVLTGIHGYLSGAVTRFAKDERFGTSGFWRILNEVPALLMVAIVILVIVKPF